MNIKTATEEKLKNRLKYLEATKRKNSSEASHIKGQLNWRNKSK